MNRLSGISRRIRQAGITCLLIFLSVSSTTTAQTVGTFLIGSGLNGPDGFALDSSGNLFVANWGGGSGTAILKITRLAVVTTFNSTLNAPDGLAFDTLGNLFVSNYSTGTINKITPDGIKTVIATGLDHPSALAFDTAGNLYVSNYGGTTVSKISPDGTVSTYASGFNAPLGLVFDPEGNLYVSNYNTGIVNRVSPAGLVTVFATVPNPTGSMIQYLVRGPSGNLYVPSYGHHKIYRISPVGVVSVFAGTGVAGGNDGPVATAQFNGPNSITLNSEGDLYISEYNANRIRKISGVEPVASAGGEQEEELPEECSLLQNYPNPFNPTTAIGYRLTANSFVTLKVYDLVGREVATLAEAAMQPGTHTASWDPGGNASGVYIYKLTAGEYRVAKKLILMR